MLTHLFEKLFGPSNTTTIFNTNGDAMTVPSSQLPSDIQAKLKAMKEYGKTQEGFCSGRLVKSNDGGWTCVPM